MYVYQKYVYQEYVYQEYRYQSIRLKQSFTSMIVLGTTLWTDSHRGRVKNLFFNRGRTPPFLDFTGFFNRTTSVGDSFMFERENALATNCARTTYYRTFSRRGSHRGSRRGCCGVTFIFIWVVPTVTVTITSIKRWNTFSRIGTCELCWRTLNWNREERSQALKITLVSWQFQRKCGNHEWICTSNTLLL